MSTTLQFLPWLVLKDKCSKEGMDHPSLIAPILYKSGQLDETRLLHVIFFLGLIHRSWAALRYVVSCLTTHEIDCQAWNDVGTEFLYKYCGMVLYDNENRY